MKKILTAAVLMSLSGTALMAAASVDVSSLPADVQAQVKSEAASKGGPAEQYTKDLIELIANYQTEVSGLITENSYLKNDPIAIILEAILTASYPGLTDQVNILQGQFATLDALYNQLLLRAYPTACKANPAAIIQGIVKYTNTRKWALYNTDQINPKLLYYFLDNVGQIGTGKEYIPSIARNDVVNAQVGPDGNGNTVVVCMDLIGPPPATPAK